MPVTAKESKQSYGPAAYRPGANSGSAALVVIRLSREARKALVPRSRRARRDPGGGPRFSAAEFTRGIPTRFGVCVCERLRGCMPVLRLTRAFALRHVAESMPSASLNLRFVAGSPPQIITETVFCILQGHCTAEIHVLTTRAGNRVIEERLLSAARSSRVRPDDRGFHPPATIARPR